MTKRILDICVALFGLVLMLPVFLLLAILVRINLGSPIIFTQLRPGKNGELFKMFKFRSMLNSIDADGILLSDAGRLTSFGAFLRSTSLDELPELWNVLIGDMSLVGPRPLLVEYLPLYSDYQFLRHEVRPGITGWAQINGRNSISWEEKFELDVWYVRNSSVFLDFKIIFLTIKKVIERDGVNSEDDVAMPKFTGREN